MPNEDFYNIWVYSVGSYEYIDFGAWVKTLPNFVTMIILVVLDCMLKLSATESKLPIKVPPPRNDSLGP